MKLVIVESPTKCKTIGHYLGDDFIVEASVGHIRDLSISGKGGFGVDVENDFKASYSIDADKKEVIKKLKKLQKEADEVILATDPDREGEAIAWHLATVLELPLESTKRLEFHEITRASINEAMNSPKLIDMNKVHSQEARRIMDRIIGFDLSGLLKSKIGSKSAGRVQSVTLKMIVEREKEINEFVSEEYWSFEGRIKTPKKNPSITLVKVDGKEVKLPHQEDADKVFEYSKEPLEVTQIITNEKIISPKEALRTSTLQQEAFTRFKFKTKETTYLAQQLYEGVEVNGEAKGLVTYIRTDSTKLSDTFIAKAKDFIISQYGKDYYSGPRSKKDVKLSQDAHEAIRPTDLSFTPELAKQYLSDHLYKLYKLIYERTLASLMSDKVEEVTTVTLKNSHLTFEIKGIKVNFAGYDLFKMDEKEENSIPTFNVGEKYDVINQKVSQHFTKPPSRYNEAKVIKLMEEEGIGRPSTYSSTLQTLSDRKYITTIQGTLRPTEQGILTINVLNKYFEDLMNVKYTAEMETNLDKIMEGTLNEVDVIRDFYNPFIENFNRVKEVMYKEPLKLTGEKCPECGSDLCYRMGKHGQFIGCSNFPKCTYIKKEEKVAPKLVGRACPNCGNELVYRANRRGQEFIGCSNFPKCKYIEGTNPDTGDELRNCPKCGAKLVLRRSRRGTFYGCSNYPGCDYAEPLNKKDE